MSPKLSPQMTDFVDAFVEHNNALKAYTLAGYKPDRSNANKMVQRLSSSINERLQERMALMTGVALSALEQIIKDPATHARDKINAINSYLDRSGIARASTQQINLKQPDTMPPNRRVIRSGVDRIIVGNGMILPPKKDSSEAYDLSDEETVQSLEARH